MAAVGSLEEESKKRKQRLLALRAKKEGKTVEELTDGGQTEAALPKYINSFLLVFQSNKYPFLVHANSFKMHFLFIGLSLEATSH